MALLSSSLTRFCCLRTKRINNGLYSPYLPCQYRLYSTSQVRQGLGRYVQMVNSKYEHFLKTRFPRFFQLYHTFVEGIKLLFRDCKEVKRIKEKMYSDKLQFKDLPYRDMEKLRQFRRDLGKAVPLLVISIPPFANYLVLLLMYLFPRQLLIPHFWTPRQQLEFQGVSHSVRVQQHQPVLSGLQNLKVSEGVLQKRLQNLCVKVQNGMTPQVSEILAVRNLFSGPPLGRLVSPLLFLTPRLPSFLMSRRLQRHGSDLLHLDRALSRLGVQNVSEAELRQACFLRGLYSSNSEVSLLLHSIVFLSANYRH
ncbi:LETM1 domain containing protein 1 [Dissostichus eleginoides]|uniref:LETM1 domain containing protein 1 n=1 Tax=Dissostichus eleginoides TaxID=100907 RepID=A0AAD9CAK9_DISEL|nr:LETM1 domain containing protein 1 [Dissostichus eleginoides]